MINKLSARQNGHHFADDTFKSISVYEYCSVLIEISLKYVSNGSSSLDNVLMVNRQEASEPMKR